MARINDWQKNPWGVTLEAQRSDLWYVNLDSVVREFSAAGLFGADEVYGNFNGGNTQFYALSVSLPEQKINSEIVRRDSRPYHMPSWDEPTGQIRMDFIHDVSSVAHPGVGRQSEIVKLLTVWRAVTRAGRGAMSTEARYSMSPEYSLPLSAANRASLHAFDIPIYLLAGAGVPGVSTETGVELSFDADVETLMQNATQYTLKNAWLSAFQPSQLSYSAAGVMTVTASFYADDVVFG